jgi:hypothetical protein
LAATTNKEVALTTITLSYKLQVIITEKQRKHQELAFEVKQQWQLNKIIVIPLVLSATRIITNMFQLKSHCP